jgi:arsenate reductase (thioredoxin)
VKDGKKRVLFVCLGNICRSPMAEALANRYGSDVLVASSAGFTPAVANSSATRATLAERNIDLGDHLPRGLDQIDLSSVDLIVNMSGVDLPKFVRVPEEKWAVKDPYGCGRPAYREVCSDLEMRVMRLILRIRLGKI